MPAEYFDVSVLPETSLEKVRETILKLREGVSEISVRGSELRVRTTEEYGQSHLYNLLTGWVYHLPGVTTVTYVPRKDS